MDAVTATAPAPTHASVPHYQAAPSVAQVARQVIYKADRDADGVLSKADGHIDSKLARAMQAMGGTKAVDQSTVRSVVNTFAGRDGRVEPGEFAKLSDAIRSHTEHMYTKHNIPDGGAYTLEQSARWLISQSDVNYDGRVDKGDQAQQSDLSGILLHMTNAPSLTQRSLENAITHYEPDLPLAQRIQDFDTTALMSWSDSAENSFSISDYARGATTVFDTDQNLRLNPEDGVMAKALLKDGAIATAREGDVSRVYAKYDVENVNGDPVPDGRLDITEWQAMDKAEFPHSRKH